MSTGGPASAGATNGPCVFVIGMHRSGTSAMTGMLAHLGVDAPADHDLIPATLSNARGHYESRTLTLIDNQLLQILGGTWSAPPPLSPGWEQRPAVAALRGPAAAAFATTFPSRPVVWKDPRNAVVLPFWRSVVTAPIAAVLVYRDAFEVARSLQSRDHLSLTHGLALWERYVRTSCADLAGIPTFVTGYTRMLDDPEAAGRDLARFLVDIGVEVEPWRTRQAVASLDAGLRHQRTTSGAPAGIEDDPRAVLGVLATLDGAHHPWRAPDLGPEPPWVEDVLTLRRDYEVLHRQVRSSRAMRVVERWWKVRGVALPSLLTDVDDG